MNSSLEARRLRFRGPAALSLAAILVLLVSVAIGADFVMLQTEEVPVERLLSNLEQLSRRNPRDVALRVNLARTHAMAYAVKTGNVRVVKGQHERGPATEHLKENVQPAVTSSTNARVVEKAREHLDKAIKSYEDALQIDSNHALARLGYGWALHQAGATAKAIEQYRAAIEAAWESESTNKTSMLHGTRTITAEAAGYLTRLLDPVQHKEEIEALRGRLQKLEEMPRAITPILIPLKPGLAAEDLVDENSRVVFDADGSGRPARWTWPTKDAGILVYDQHNRGRISSALQWFGNVTFWLFWTHGYDAMTALDDDGDRRLAGGELTGLAIWRDVNENGISEPGEVASLARWGIVALSCSYRLDERHRDEIPTSQAGVTFADGTTRPTYDVLLRRW